MKLNSDIERLLEQRYYKPGETWPDLVNRVVDHVCEDEDEHHQKRMIHYYIFYLLEEVFFEENYCEI